MGDKALSIAKKHLLASRDVVDAAIADDKFIETITKIAALVTDRLRAGNKALFAGNGGSAADAQHIAGEFVSRLNFDRDPISGIALTTDSSVLTAIGNDYGYEQVFARQVRGLGRTGDILFAISTSGRSPNVLAAVAAAGGRRHSHRGFYAMRRFETGRLLRYRSPCSLNGNSTCPANPHNGGARDM